MLSGCGNGHVAFTEGTLLLIWDWYFFYEQTILLVQDIPDQLQLGRCKQLRAGIQNH